MSTARKVAAMPPRSSSAGPPDPSGGRRSGADAAIEELYAGHWRPLVRLAVLLLGEESGAEEVVQDAFVALHGRWERLDSPDRARAYLRRSVVNGCRSSLRHRTVVQRHAERAAPEQPAPGADSTVLARERRQLVYAALARLPRRQREVITLRYYLDLSEAEIATTLGVSRGAVKSHSSRGIRALRHLLEDTHD